MTFIPRTQSEAKKISARGKKAEDTVHEILKDMCKNAGLDVERNYDARSAQGLSYARRCGDFSWYTFSKHGVIEVKETGAIATLPYKNFEPHQVGKMVRRKMAGGSAYVVVYHTKTDLWRYIPIDFFRERPDTAASWNLSEFPEYAHADDMPIFDYIKACMAP